MMPLTPDALYDSAREFAGTALAAHHDQKYRRVAVDAGTALEHLAKACLAQRSPALLTELKSEANFPSLLRLLGMVAGEPPRQLRTVGLRDALARVRMLVTSQAAEPDLRMLVDMRDGTVHAAQDEQVEERLLAAFVQHADALIADLGRDRAEFWGGQLAVVDALLVDATDRVAHRVGVKLAEARANFQRRFGTVEPRDLEMALDMLVPDTSGSLDAGAEARADCPACGWSCYVYGTHFVQWDDDQDGNRVGTVWFLADGLVCRFCGLHLDTAGEIKSAAMKSQWQIEDADPALYDLSG
jgi:hypothetical protein